MPDFKFGQLVIDDEGREERKKEYCSHKNPFAMMFLFHTQYLALKLHKFLKTHLRSLVL